VMARRVGPHRRCGALWPLCLVRTIWRPDTTMDEHKRLLCCLLREASGAAHATSTMTVC
jgi:hypothetical protein